MKRRFLLLKEQAAQPPLPSPPSPGRRIVINCDGTGNRPDMMEEGEVAATNVWRIHHALDNNEQQMTWYQQGVGSGASSAELQAGGMQRLLTALGDSGGGRAYGVARRIATAIGAAFGVGITEGIVNGYAEIVRQYRPGDRIYLIGFSRGAYTARCIAGVIARCGLLKAENHRFAADIVRLYQLRQSPTDPVQINAAMVHQSVSIEVLGLFDTVASLGAPLWGWWFRLFPLWAKSDPPTTPAKVCRHIYHALAMDERRSQFLPTLFDPIPPNDLDHEVKTLEQVWFRGAHADIGGGYARRELSDISLGWMVAALTRHGLTFAQDLAGELHPRPLGRLHDELARQPAWRLFGSWPRWHPTPDSPDEKQLTKLHRTVTARSANITAGTGRPDCKQLRVAESIDFTADARFEWDRTGIVIEKNAFYKLTFVGGEWRDAECPPCGPSGQKASGLFDMRRFLGWGRRSYDARWMEMMATVAHPRRWPLKERPLWRLLALIFCNRPPELINQLARIGQHLNKPGDCLFIENKAASGLLYLFANDWWQTAGNNSGGLHLRIARIDELTAGHPRWIIDDKGESSISPAAAT